MPKRPVVVDANSVIVRAIMASALDDLKAGGIYTGGIYGSLGSLKSIVSSLDAQAGRVVAFFDNGVPPRRRELVPGYKSDRQARSGQLSEEEKERAYVQIEQCYELWPTLGIQCLSYKDREADDGVAAACRIFIEQGHAPLVVSSDRDLWQVCRWGAEVWVLKAGLILTADNFEGHTEVSPELWLLYRALVGDSSDSIPGIDGCGPKRAGALMSDLRVRPGEDPVSVLLSHLRSKDRLLKHEQAVLEGEDHIRTVMEAIDLSRSFGGLRGLRKRLAEPPAVDKRAFLRKCRELSFDSVLGDPDGYLGPFQRAASAS